MTIKKQGGIFGRNPKFHNVTIDGDINLAGTAIPNPSTILVNSDINSTVQGYDENTAKYDDVIANFSGTLQEDGNNVVTVNEVGTVASQNADNVIISGGSIDGVTLGVNSSITEAQIDNIKINNNSIDSTNTDGNINFNPNGTGYVDIKSKQRITVNSGVMQEFYSTDTTVFTGSTIADADIIGSDGGEAKIAYQSWRGANNHSPGSRGVRLYFGLADAGTQTATDKLYINDTGSLRPVENNSVSLGAPSNLWSEVFAGNGTINTSDEREKTAVRSLNEQEIKAAKDLGKEIGAFKFLNAIDQKGDEARLHIGMTVQRAIKIMQSYGLDPMAYGFICYDQWDEIVHSSNVEGKNEVTQPAGNRYGFRTDQLLLFIARGFEERLSNLEGL